MNSISYTLITGASSGIGEAFARQLAEEGKPLILVARRQERLLALTQTFPSIPIQVVPLDLNHDQAAEELFSICQQNGWQVEGLINNAGLGFQSDFSDLSVEKIHATLHVNLVSLAMLTRLFLTPMIERKQGFILNVASTAGFQALPHFSVYAATKAFIINFSEGVHQEVKPHRVLVTCLCPGPVHTEFRQKAHLSKRFFSNAQTADKVARIGLRALRNRKALVWTSPWNRLISWGAEALVPRFLLRPLAAYSMSFGFEEKK